MPHHTDHAGVMWHGTYLAWLEEARIEALSKVGLNYSDFSRNGYEMPVISLEINYHKALHHGERVLLKSWTMLGEGVRWPWRSQFFSENGSLAADANICLVLTMKIEGVHKIIRKVPDKISNGFDKLKIGLGD